jgi:hypothetical protein
MNKCLAAIDIGSNTVHLIVAATDGTRLTVLADDSIFVRLADGVWNQGFIPDERVLATAQAMLHLRGVARAYGAEQIAVVATEVARTARNTHSLLSVVEGTTGLTPLVLSGMDEALLTFRGVTQGRHLPASVAVADLGGGSLEVIIAELGHGAWRTSLPIGSAFMHDRFTPHDPPHPVEVSALNSYLAEKLSGIPRLSHVEELLVSGGTVNALMRLVQQAQGRATGDLSLRRRDLDHALQLMLEQPAALIAARYRLRIERARLLPTGAIILAALLDHLRLPGIVVSAAGIREGVILACAEYGQNWLERVRADAYHHSPGRSRVDVLPGAAHALNGASANGYALDLPHLAYQPAAEVAWQLIRDQGEALLGYRKGVLSGDIDAVHDMRVATRRLRTLLDTFAPCFTEAAVRELRQAVKRMTRSLGVVRDADVAIEQLTAQRAAVSATLIAGLDLLIKQHRDSRKQARRTLKDDLSEGRVKHLRHCLRALHLPADKIVPAGCVREQSEMESSLVEEGKR